ncbi:MAG: T9SS type A sorting domain-containing protein, partial [Bacteroidota bacterium]
MSNGGAGVTSGFAYGIGFGAANNSTIYEIYNNKIYNIYTNGSTTSRAIGIQINGSTQTDLLSKVYNNMISDLRAPRSTSNPGVRGLDMQNAGGSGTMIVYHNTVHLDNTDAPAVTGTNVAHTSTCLYFASMTVGTGTNLDVRNNIFMNEMGNSSTGTGTSRACAVLTSNNGNFLKYGASSDYNLYYVSSPAATNRVLSCDLATLTGFLDLAAHQTALSNTRDMNSKSAVVNFSNGASDLHIAGASLGDATNLIASVLPSPYNVDIDGHSRNASTPYKGADENTSTLLPVELTSFTATAKGKSIELKWTTATETNNHGFDVERSVNGVWTKIGFVQGAGNSNAPKEYGYTDAVNNGGRFSYRLKQIDRDGKFTYNDAIEVVVNSAVNNYELAQNFPNPFNPVTTIRFSVKQLEQTSVKVYDITGREVAELFNGVASPGQVYNVQFNGTGLASGIYFYVL